MNLIVIPYLLVCRVTICSSWWTWWESSTFS